MFAVAYIKPEYNWAQNVANYNQTNLTFELNVEDGVNNATVSNVVNRNRDSASDENDNFWIGYILIGYQGPILEDSDGLNSGGTGGEPARQGVAPAISIVGSVIGNCDCYMSSNCPQGGVVCSVPNPTPNQPPIPKIPRGAFGSIIFQEVQ